MDVILPGEDPNAIEDLTPTPGTGGAPEQVTAPESSSQETTPSEEGTPVDPLDVAIQRSQLGIDPKILKAIARQESGNKKVPYNPNAESPAGAMGAMQVMPHMWQAYGGGDPYDLNENVKVGGRIYGDELARFSGNVPLALAAYNAGSPAVINAMKKLGYNLKDADKVSFEEISSSLPEETQNYVPSVLKHYREQTTKTESDTDPFNPQNVGTLDDVKKKLIPTLTDESRANTSVADDLTEVRKLWDEKPYWAEDAKALLKKITSRIWQKATPEEKVNFAQVLGGPPVIKGKTSAEQEKELLDWKSKTSQELVDNGIDPLFFGDELDNYYKRATTAEKAAAAYRNRGIFGEVFGYPTAFVEEAAHGLVQGVASSVSAAPRLFGFESTADYIDAVAERLTPEVRPDFNYQVDSLGRLKTDEYGNPLRTWQGKIANMLGFVGSFFIPTSAMKVLKIADEGSSAFKAVGISNQALLGANMAYQDAVANGGDRNEAIHAAVYSLPANTIDALVNLEILRGGKAWLKGMGPLSKARAMSWQFIKSTVNGGSANALRQYLQDAGVTVAIGKNITSGERVLDAALTGGAVGGIVGALSSKYERGETAKDNLRPLEPGEIPPESPGKLPPPGSDSPPPASPPGELPRAEEQVRLTAELEDFQKSPEMQRDYNIRSEADIDPEQLNTYGVKHEMLPDGKVRLIKETTFIPPADITALSGALLEGEILKTKRELETAPKAEDREKIAKELADINAETRTWSEDTRGEALKAEQNLQEVERIDKEISDAEAQKKANPKDKLIDNHIEDLKDARARIAPFTSESDIAVKNAKKLRRLVELVNQQKELIHPMHENNILARDNYLKDLIDRSIVSDLETKQAEWEAKKSKLKEGELEPPEPQPKLGRAIKTKDGIKYLRGYRGKWYLLGEDGVPIERGFNRYTEAIDFAKSLKKTSDRGTLHVAAEDVKARENGVNLNAASDEGISEVKKRAPMLTRQPLKQSRIPLGNEFNPREVYAATSQKEMNPRTIMKSVSKALSAIVQAKRQSQPFSRSGINFTPEEAARRQKEAPFVMKEGGRGARNAWGFLDWLRRYIKVDTANDFVSAVHELAHGNSMDLFPDWKAVATKQELQGIIKQAHAFYGDEKILKAPIDKQLDEGWATLIEHHISGMQTNKAAMGFYNGWFKEHYPELHSAIEDLKSKAVDYYQMSPYTYAKVFTGAKPATKQLIPSSSEIMDNWINEYAIYNEMQKAAGNKNFRIGDIAEAEKGRANELAGHFTHGDGELSDWYGNKIKDSMTAKEAIAPAKGKFSDLTAYLVSKYTLQRQKEGKRTGFAVKDAEYIVNDIENVRKDNDIMTAAQNFWRWHTDILAIAGSRSKTGSYIAANIMNENLKKTGFAHGFYVPFAREFADMPGQSEGTYSPNPYKRFSGSDRRIQDPLLRMEDHAYKLLNAAQNSYMRELMVEGSKMLPIGQYIAKIPKAQIPRLKASMENVLRVINKKLEESGEEPIKNINENLMQSMLTFFGPELKLPKGADGYEVMPYIAPGGNVEFYEVNSRVMKALDSSMPDFTKDPWFQWMFTKPGRIMRVGATTARMAYQLRNIAFRDFFTAYRRIDQMNPITLAAEVLKSFGAHAWDALSGGKSTNPWIQLEKSLGVYNANQLGSARDIETQVSKQAGLQVRNVTGKSLAYLENLFSTGEQATRTAAMKLKARELGITDPTKPLTPEQTLELILAKKRSTTNFQVYGKSSRVANQMIPFFSARIAELSQLPRDWREHPGKMAAYASGYLAAGIALALANKDEKWWQNLNPEEKATNIMFTMPDSTGVDRVARIALETHAGVFFGLGNMIGEQLYRQDLLKPSNPEAFWALLKQFTPITSAFDILGVPGKELAQQELNYDAFFNKSIVPGGLKDMPAHLQATARTTELSKAMADRLHEVGVEWSPIRIDHAMRAIAPASIDYIRKVEETAGIKPISDENATPVDFLQSLVTRGGYKEGVMDRSLENFYRLSDTFRTNKDIETHSEGEARKKLDKIREAVSDINTILSVETDTSARQQLYEHKRDLLEKGIAIGSGEFTLPVGGSPLKGKAKTVRKSHKMELQQRAKTEEGSSLFSQ